MRISGGSSDVCSSDLEHAVGGDHDRAGAIRARLLQLLFQVRHVAVGVAVAPGLAQAHAVDARGVVERVGDEGIVLAQQRLQQAAVGVEDGSGEVSCATAESSNTASGPVGSRLCINLNI